MKLDKAEMDIERGLLTMNIGCHTLILDAEEALKLVDVMDGFLGAMGWPSVTAAVNGELPKCKTGRVLSLIPEDPDEAS